MSNPTFTPQENLLFDKNHFTSKDGYRCVSQGSKKEGLLLETLFEPSSPEYHKMTHFPIYLYKDDKDNYYCFSDKSLQVVERSQQLFQTKNPVNIEFINKFTEDECKSESKYHSEFLEKINPRFKKVMGNIYNIDEDEKDPDAYKIYFLSYNFLRKSVFTLSDVADMIQLYYSNYAYCLSDGIDKWKNYFLIDAQKRVNYKYACLTRAKKESEKGLKIDIGHEYRIKILFLIGDNYEFVKEELIPFFFGGQATIIKYLQMISRILRQGKTSIINNITKEDITVLQKLQKIILLFQDGFQNQSIVFQKVYADVNIQEIIDIINPTRFTQLERSNSEEDIEETNGEKEDEKEDKKQIVKHKKKKKKEKQQSIDIKDITELFNVQVEVEKYFRLHFGLVKKLYRYFEKFCQSHILTFPYSFSMCMNYIEKEKERDEKKEKNKNIELLSNDDFQKMFVDSINKFNQNNYFMDRIVDVYHFFLKSYNKNNIICNLIKCDPNVLESTVQIKDYKTRIVESSNNYKKTIKSLEKQCQQIYKGQLGELFSSNILPLNFISDLQNDLKGLYDQAQYLNNKNLIVFPDEDDESEEYFRSYETRAKDQIKIIENELKTVSNKVSVMEKLIVNLQENLSKTEDENNIEKINQNIEKTQSKLHELKTIGEENLNKIYQYTILFYSSMIMRLFYYYNYLWIENDKINLLDELQNNLLKLQKYEKQNPSQDHKHAILYSLLQEELQCINVEISVLLTQSFNTSTFNKAYIYQEEITNKILDANFFNTYSINDLETHIQMFRYVIYLGELNNEYQNLINTNIMLQQNIRQFLPSQMILTRSKEQTDKISDITNRLNTINAEIENIETNKTNLCGYYFRQIFQGQHDDFLEQIIDQYDDLNTKVEEIFELYMSDYKSHQGLDFYYFYNDEFYECNQTLMRNNVNTLKNVLETIMTKRVFTVTQKTQIQLLIFSLISGVFISYFYYKCKLQVLEQVPDVSINIENVKQLSVINEINIQTNKIKQSYVELFISRYMFQEPSTTTSSSSSFISSSLLK